ncbi:peptidylprolyl isomerase [Candidatus Woesearchaeota archaeon]|nr:peptidylprolyl isomerase [Candidatus Woesearchaeota archaeon]
MVIKKIKKGDVASVEYTGTLEDGTVFSQSSVDVEAGNGAVIKGFDEALLGMKEGEEKTISVKPEDAYGNIDERLVRAVPKKDFPEKISAKPGTFLRLRAPNGQMLFAGIKSATEDSVVLDMNHPLAGKTLNFRIKVVTIR